MAPTSDRAQSRTPAARHTRAAASAFTRIVVTIGATSRTYHLVETTAPVRADEPSTVTVRTDGAVRYVLVPAGHLSRQTRRYRHRAATARRSAVLSEAEVTAHLFAAIARPTA